MCQCWRLCCSSGPRRLRGAAYVPAEVEEEACTTYSKQQRPELKHLLDTYGEYPSKYRVLIWRTLLSLPLNKGAYRALRKQGVHSTFENLEEDYPIKNNILLGRLTGLVSCLAHWTPLFGQVTYLPAFVFPFIKAFALHASCTIRAYSWSMRFFDECGV